MFNYFLFITLISFIYAFEPSCSSCKFFIPNSIKQELGLCSMFQDTIYINNQASLVKNLAVHCRSDENLCGNAGFLYESTNNKQFEKYVYARKIYGDEFIEETNLQELENIEKELISVFQKMRRHNTKRIYRTTKELYKLFKKDKNNDSN